MNPNRKEYEYYGGRGITVCDRWLNSFENFLTDMGKAPTEEHTLDRIDNDGNYEPANCRWATQSEQNSNRGPQRTEWTEEEKNKELKTAERQKLYALITKGLV